MSNVTTPESRGTELLKALGLVVGLLAGAIGLLYAAGGGVLMLRLYLEDLPSLTVVGQLPREYLISIALTQIVLPALVAGGLYLAGRLLLVRSARPPERLVHQWSRDSASGRWALLAVGAAIAIALTLLGGIPALVRKGVTQEVVWLFAISFVVTLVVVLVALRLRSGLATRERNRWNEFRPKVAMALIVAFTLVPACVLFAGTFHLLDAKVCTTEQLEVSGVLVGQTDRSVLIGEERVQGEKRNVSSIPLDMVERIVIGGSAAEAACR